METTSRGKKYNYYICSTHKHGGNCTAHRIKEDELKEIVLYEIQLNVSLLIDIETVIVEIEADPARNTVAKTIEKRVAAANVGIKKINAAIADLYIDYKDGLFDKDDFLTLKKNYEKQLTESKNALKLLNEQLKDSTSGKVDSNTFAELKKYKNVQTLSREIIVRLIDRIDFYEDNRINITFSFEDEYAAVVEAISNSETEAV